MKHIVLGSALLLMSTVAASANDTCYNNRDQPYHCQQWAFTSESSSSVSSNVSGSEVTNGTIGDLTLTGPDGSICRVHVSAGRRHTVMVSSPDGCAFINPEAPQK